MLDQVTLWLNGKGAVMDAFDMCTRDKIGTHGPASLDDSAR
jgi:hypothetical protein